MKTELTKEQSARLIELGVPKEKASIKKIDEIRVIRNKEVCDWSYKFTLTDLLEILPKEIRMENATHSLRIESWECSCGIVWDVQYVGIPDSFIQGGNLINLLFETLCWVIENGHLKFD